MKARFELAGAQHRVSPLRRPGGLDLVIDGRRRQVELRDLGGGERLLLLDGRPFRLFLAHEGDLLHLQLGGRVHRVTRVDERDAAGGSGGGADELRAPMPGTVVAVAVTPGAAVARGDLLLTIESMKLETAIRAPRDGVVAEVARARGDTFEKGALLVRLEPAGEEAT